MSTVLRSPIKIGDRTYDASPLTDDAKDALDEWVRMKYRERVIPLLNELEGNALTVMTREVLNDLPTLTFMSHKGARFMGTVEGMARLVYEMVRPNHSDVSYEKLCKDMVNPEHIIAAKEKFRQLQKLDEPPAVPEGKETGS